MGWSTVDAVYGIVMVVGQTLAVLAGVAILVFGAAGAVQEWHHREYRRRQRVSDHPATVGRSVVRRVPRVYDWERDGTA
jgi:hypothetical protein